MKTPNADAAIDRLLETDPELVRLDHVLRQQERRLRKAMSPRAFRAYLDVEATANALLGTLAEKR